MKETIRWEDIDPSLPLSVYDPDHGIDLVWTLMRQEAQREAAREPLLVSFIYSTILNHASLESALAFHLSNRLASSAMLSTQVMSLFQEAFGHNEPYPQSSRSYSLGKSLRADILAVRSRDPACTCLPDVFLYFKGFHALQTHRVAHYLWKSGRKTLANFFQSQMAQIFQIDIHPNASIGCGIMLDHGTGVVIGETAVLGDNCSVLHHVTLGGSGKKGKDRHPKIGKGVLLGAGATVLGNIHVGDGCQIGAGTLVIEDLPPHSVAVGVPARIIGKFVKENEVPSTCMDQMLGGGDELSVTNIEFSI
jgi:serine O-acetyltransferase